MIMMLVKVGIDQKKSIKNFGQVDSSLAWDGPQVF
jgi:hypothetical protein